MNLTTKARYAVMAMVDLSINGDSKPVVLADIAQRQDIALSYLEQIFMRLRRADIVKSVRGPGGGYVIMDNADKLPISKIVLAVDESIKMTRCNSGKGGCASNNSKCITHNLWEGLTNQIFSYLNSVTLGDVCNRNVKINNIGQYQDEYANV